MEQPERVNMVDLKTNIEQLAAAENKSPLDVITLAQAGCVVTKNEALLEALCELKWDYIPVEYH